MTGNMTEGQSAHGPKHKRNVTRRKVVVAGGAAVAAVGVGGTIAATANSRPDGREREGRVGERHLDRHLDR